MEKPPELKGKKWNHHFTPEFYLKGFVEPGTSHGIWVYTREMPYYPGRKTKNNPRNTSVSTAGSEGGYYADVDGEGNIDSETFEDLLMKREKAADSVLTKLRQKQELEEDNRSIFSEYLAQMLIRGPRARANVTTMVPGLLDSFSSDEALLTRMAGPDGPEKRARLKRILATICERYDLGKRTHLQILSSPLGRAMAMIRAMSWTFYIAPRGESFLTADNPVFFFKALGLNKPNSELSFPISSDVAFVASWRNGAPEGFAKTTSRTVVRLNRRMAEFASKELYFSRNEQWVVNLLSKKHLYSGLRL